MSMTTELELAQRMKAAALNATPGRLGDRIDGSGSIKYQCFGNDGSLVLQTDHKNMEYGFIGPNSKADELFFRECSPENVRALVEALEASQSENERMYKTLSERNGEPVEGLVQRIAELEEKQRLIDICQGQGLEHRIAAEKRAEAAEKRNAELEESHAQVIQSRDHYKRMSEEGLKAIRESRTVKLPKPISVLHRRDFNDAHQAIYAYPEAEVNEALASAGIQVIEGEQNNG